MGGYHDYTTKIGQFYGYTYLFYGGFFSMLSISESVFVNNGSRGLLSVPGGALNVSLTVGMTDCYTVVPF